MRLPPDRFPFSCLPALCLLLALEALPAQEQRKSGAESASSPEPLTFVAYNLRNYLAMDRRLDGEAVEGAPKPEREIAALVEGLAEIVPDILGVCEIGDPGQLDDFQQRLRRAGIDLPHTELVRAKSGYDRNLALLSRFPIVASNSRDNYAYELDNRKFVFQRGVLDTTVAPTPGYRLRLVGLHLKSKRPVPEANEAAMRLHEARLARKHIDRILAKNPETNLLVYGDFNDLRIEAPVKTLQGRYGQDDYLASLTLADRFGFRWTHYWSYADSYSRFDYVLYSKAISREIDRKASRIHHWENWDKASDHRPLVVRLVPEDEDR